MHHTSATLDVGSYFKPSLSQATLKSATPSREDLKTNKRNDIFAAKTADEISHNYHKILLTYGKWNAEMYLSILNELNEKPGEDVQPLDISPLPDLRKMHCGEMKMSSASLIRAKYENITRNCTLCEEEINKSGRTSTGLSSDQDVEGLAEPSYRRIFKNARLRRNPRRGDESLEVLTVPSSKRPEKAKFIEQPSEDTSVVHQDPCQLEKDVPNNYLLDLRKSRSERGRKKVSFGSASECYVDDIERYYKNTPIQTVLENNLQEQIELMRATLKAHVNEVSGIDLLGETGHNKLRGRCLNDTTNTARFQSMFNDSRWRKKFELKRIEDSDDADSLDVSDIPSSETATVCSGDSLGSELDYRPKPIPPSRIPCIAEVREMGDILFDKIATKWERTIKKNFIDSNMKPCFTHFCNAVRLRSTAPVYSGILKSLGPYDGLYTKAFTPLKYRMEGKLEKLGEMQKAKNALVRHRRSFESRLIGVGGPRSASPRRYIDHAPTKYRGQKQRRRLARVILETKKRSDDGLARWTNRTMMEDYVNLKPLIQTKNSRNINSEFISEPTVQSIRPRSTKMPHNVHSLRNYEASLYLSTPNRSPPCSSPPSKNKLIAGSKSKLLMPI